ncbi:DUF3530 domain-containing protein [Oceanimonas sp. CHS3-5]|uniref:DUF3530 family protein n=1 Tax=Oceanimonas sp. CHS3-5 TaxID=3068186 RepID=UPI00273EFA2B|nr:DUF3530 family protein [Oceanimonas sp. CHS3-5]MDP5293733.1 DUF3530 domain-containing protein [Oceanimonas sp. CHS3-5]
MRRACVLMLGWLSVATAGAQTDWTAYRQYSAEAGQLRFDATRPEALGTLVVWPEQQQAHHWLAMAPWWQQRGWNLVLLLPDAQQHQFDPTNEQPSDARQQWLAQLASRLSELPNDNPNATQLVLTQGSATLWYQQLVETGQLPPPAGLVVVDATPSQPEQQRMLAVSLSRSNWPVLDLFSKQNNTSTINQAQRQHSATRQAADYTAEQLADPSRPERHIAAWLVRRGWMPLPPGAPDYLKGKHAHETGISRPADPGPER